MGLRFKPLISYFGGLTIKIPTLRELKLVINGMLLYEYVNIDNIEYKQALKLLEEEDFTQREIKDVYNSIVSVLEKYDFKREQ